ncbi:MAG: RHS repeat-associated core domain-containing protein [Candidatus Acidiferrales bacterium]
MVTFKYDPFGRRIEKISPTATNIFAYDGPNLIETVNASGSEVASYAQDQDIDEPLAMDRSGTVDYYEQDGLRSITSLTASTGSVSQSYTYDSFGNQTASSGSLTNFFRYTAREFDTESNLYFYRARYYDPNGGRFISEDPLQFRADLNFYRYVRNNPSNQGDPFGLCDKNCSISVDCGPTQNTHGFSHCTVTVQNGSTFTSYDGEPEGGIWWGTLKVVPGVPGQGLPPGPNSFVNAPVPCDCAEKEALAINAAGLVYSAPIQNSNTAAAMLVEACGISTPFRSTTTWGWGPADPLPIK